MVISHLYIHTIFSCPNDDLSSVHTIFSCPNGDLCVVVSLLHCHRDDGDVVGVVRKERSKDNLSGFRVDNLPPPGPCLQFCDVESVLPDEAIVSIVWRVVPVYVDGGGVKRDGSDICRASNWS